MEVCGSQEYMKALEEELNKIMLFQKELPLSLQLVTQAIDACRRQMATERAAGSGSESVETSSEDGRLLEEFIPIKRDSDSPQDQGDKEADKSDGSSHHRDKKADWLRSLQLWSQEAEASPDEVVDSSKKRLSSSSKKRAASVLSCKEKTAPTDKIATKVADHGGASSSARFTPRDDDKEGQLQKKARRCWSPELHRRFLHALQQLGGSHATPKHIKQLMKVDGLTNEEIKSHLQKYRLHTRPPASPSFPISNSETTQLLVAVSGIWGVSELTAAAASSVPTPEAAVSAIYTPVVITSTTEPSTTLATPMGP